MSPSSGHEVMASLRALQRRLGPASQGVFRFAWGDLEYTKLGAVIAQFEEIFVQRQYAFSSKTTSPVIVDCGGNIGLSAIWFKQAYPDSRLTVYEADPRLHNMLQRNLQRAGVTDIAVHHRAVWTEDTWVSFDDAGDDAGRIDSTGRLKVPAIDLVHELPARVDLLKMDIEGSEYVVLDRLCQTGAIDRVARLVCEFHVTRERTGDLLSTLGRLKEAGMELSMTAHLTSWTGSARLASPFHVVDQNNVFMIVYAWHASRCT
jgi:FkbM family methyltransferase